MVEWCAWLHLASLALPISGPSKRPRRARRRGRRPEAHRGRHSRGSSHAARRSHAGMRVSVNGAAGCRVSRPRLRLRPSPGSGQ